LTASKNALNDASSVVHAQYRGIEKTITQANTSGERIIGIMRAEVRAVQSAIDTVQTSVLRQLRVGIGSTQQHVIASGSYVVAEQGRAVTSTTTSLSGIEQNIRLSDPARNLKLGYSLSYVEGKLVRSIADVPVGGVTTTRLADGSFTSDITKIT
jgi:exonuclease VII large subunit